jgi:hypothetical protein
MTREILAQALETEGLQAASHGFSIPENREATVFLAIPGDLFPVERVVRIELRDKVVMLENVKHERFLFGYDQVVGLRLITSAAAKDRVPGPGFGR